MYDTLSVFSSHHLITFFCIDMVEGTTGKEYQTDVGCGDSEACMVWCPYASYISGGYCKFKDKEGLCVCMDCM
jgi:hypothetical protein